MVGVVRVMLGTVGVMVVVVEVRTLGVVMVLWWGM